jgi:hypothetical protein
MDATGAVASTEFSSSTGGWTAGGTFPAVEDLGDAVAANPYHSWTTTVTTAVIQSTWPSIGTLTAIVVTARDGNGDFGGRVLTLELHGSAGVVHLTGATFQAVLGLRSTWFSLPVPCDGRVEPPLVPLPAPAPATYQPLTPVRILDTRSGIGSTALPLAGGCVLPLTLAGVGGVPASGATAATLNLTAVAPLGSGYVEAYPCGITRPLASSINVTTGAVVANLVTVALPVSGQVCLYSSVTVHLVADLQGWYGGTSTSRFFPLAPARLLDTRIALGIGTSSPVTAGSTLALTVAGRGGVPATGATGVTVGVVAVGPDRPGFVTVWPCGQARPLAANLNVTKSVVIANLVQAALATAGTICLYTTATTHLVVDVQGYFASAGGLGSLFVPAVPARLLDTRSGFGAPGPGAVQGGVALPVTVTGRAGVPSTGVVATVVNIAVVAPTGSGFVTAYACGTPLPPTANVNYAAGQVRANAATARLGASGQVCLRPSATTQLVADVQGWYGS